MLDRKILLALAAAGIFAAVPSARSHAASADVHLASMNSSASDDDDKGSEKGDWKHKDKDEDHDGKDEDHDKHGKGERDEKKEIEQPVPMNMVPQAAIDAVMKECPGGKITEAELVAKKGKITYSFDVRTADMAYDVKISVDGKFISKKVDDDDKDDKDEKPAVTEKK